MPFRFLTVALLALFCAHAAFAQSEITSYSDRSSFAAASENLTTVDFEGIAPNSGFRNFNREGHFAVSGIDFRPGGGARFGPGFVTIVGHQYQAGPAYETGTGAKMHWSPPNQPGNAYLDISLPNGTTAVGIDLWAAQPYVSPVEVLVTTTKDSRTFTINTPNRPAVGFVGVVSDSAVTSIRLTPAKGQTGFALDNFSFGRARAGDKRGSEKPSTETPRASTTQAVTTPRTETPRASTTQPVTAPRTEEPLHDPPGLRPETEPKNRPQTAGGSGGTIAYIRGTEIRAISPDGTNDRRLWTHPDLRPQLGLHDLAWRPDGKELAFSSSHAAPFSFYDGDIFTIKPDGSGLRKITNAPDKSEFARYRKGTVTVTVRNDQDPGFTPGSFIVYVIGADEPQQIELPAGTEKTLVFKSVADFGNHPQPVVAMFADRRWFTPGTDVQAGRNVTAPVFSISGKGIQQFGATRPVWRNDGSRISYRSGLCLLSTVSANPAVG